MTFARGLIVFTVSATAWGAGFDDCSHHFYAATEPDYINSNLLKQSAPLCFNGFATLYSGVTSTPLWSAEHLTRERLYQADELPRDDSFHSESRLPKRMQAQVSDYKGSGYDRGHLAPNADMATPSQQYDSFSLANIIPQSPDNNRYVWRNLESVTRYLTKKYGEVYVVTGVAFIGDDIEVLNDQVYVPTHIFKALYIPSTQAAGAYYAPNDDTKRVEVISLDELALRSGIDVFPAIPTKAKSQATSLSLNVSDMNKSDTATATEPQEEASFIVQLIVAVLRWIIQSVSGT